MPLGEGGWQFGRQYRRRGQRIYSDATRRRALELARDGVAPVDIAARLGVPRGTIRSWLSRARLVLRQSHGPELEQLADHAEELLADYRRMVAEGDPKRALAAALDFAEVADALMLRDGTAPPEVLARLTVDPWTGEPLRGRPGDAARRRRGY